MTTSEPTTGEIVRALRCVAEAIECKDCRYKYPVGNVILCDHEQMNGNAADRLESQEHEIVGLTELNKAEYVLYKSEIDAYRIASESLKLTILRYMDMTQALTARAEQAEKERDKAMADLFGFCSRCKHDGCKLENEPCKSCMKDYPMKQLQNWTWRGLPQDGEGK